MTKETVEIISSDPPFVGLRFQFTTVPLKPLKNKNPVNIFSHEHIKFFFKFYLTYLRAG